MTTPLTLRALTLDDYDAARELVEACYPNSTTIGDEFSARLALSVAPDPNPHAHLLQFVGAFTDQTLVGLGAYSRSPMGDTYWELGWACVAPDKRHQGIGGKILDYRVEQIRLHMNCDPSFVLVSTTPTRLYHDAGFTTGFPTRGPKAILYKELRR